MAESQVDILSKPVPSVWALKFTNGLDTAKLMFCYGPTMEDSEFYALDNALEVLKHPLFDKEKSTMLYIHGYVETLEHSVRVVVESYLKRRDHNILVLEWSHLAEGNYLFNAVPNSRKLGKKVARVLEKLLIDFDGIPVDKFHLVGHSLGSQMSGLIGREIINNSGGNLKLKRITGLDPAFPPFYPSLAYSHISKNDAEFVDIIHTDAWLYGTPFTTGTADYWPNSGKSLQPGCPKRNYKTLTDNDLCSHRRSFEYYAESVATMEPSFPAVYAKSWDDFRAGNTSVISFMGIDASPGVSGNFYLQTNDKSPFCKGKLGIKYQKVLALKE